MDWILEPWEWYISGPLIALVMILLIVMGKSFGMSSNLRTLCTICGAGKTSDFFRFDWKKQRWNLLVIAGAFIGGFIAKNYLSTDTVVTPIGTETISELKQLGFMSAGNAYTATELYSSDVFENPEMLMILLIAGVLLGFGSRYAGGCTSGHAISGLSNLQMPSLIAVIGFFIGGLIMSYFIIPQLF